MTDTSTLAVTLHQLLVRRLRAANGADRRSGLDHLIGYPTGLAAGDAASRLTQRLRNLAPRVIRPEGAMALALNSFLPWLGRPEELQLAGITRFRELNFDARCPTGVRGTPPHIELVASGPAGVVGVTVRVFEYLQLRQSKLSAAYTTLELPPALQAWAALMRPEVERDERYRYVDVSALGKLAVGLGRIFEHRPVRLLYVFLEPIDAAGMSPFVDHRAELARVTERTQDSAVVLAACSFHELWEEWCAAETPATLREIAAELRSGYAIDLPH